MSSSRNQKQFVVGIEIYLNQFQVIIMSKRRHFGPSGNTPGKSRPKRSMKPANQREKLCLLHRPSIQLVHNVMKSGHAKNSVRWWSMQPFTGMALTPTDGQAQKVCVFGMIVLQQSNRVQVSQNEQVSLTTRYNFNLEVSDIFF